LKGAGDSLDVAIRLAESTDYEAWRGLCWQVNDLHHRALPMDFVDADKISPPKELFEKFRTGPESGLFIAECDGKAVAFLQVGIREAEHPVLVPKKYAYVSDLVVDGAFHSQGIGTALMMKAESWALERGLHEIRLNVSGFNTPAQRLYEKSGYERNTISMRKMI
jgi:shikimate dehydrogenase